MGPLWNRMRRRWGFCCTTLRGCSGDVLSKTPADRRLWLLHRTPAARPKLSQLRKLGEVTRTEALAGVPEGDTERLLKTLQALKANLTDACDSPVAGQKRASHV